MNDGLGSALLTSQRSSWLTSHSHTGLEQLHLCRADYIDISLSTFILSPLLSQRCAFLFAYFLLLFTIFLS